MSGTSTRNCDGKVKITFWGGKGRRPEELKDGAPERDAKRMKGSDGDMDIEATAIPLGASLNDEAGQW